MSGYICFCLKIFFTFTNSVDPDEMQYYASFHLGLHCLPKYLFRGFPYTNLAVNLLFQIKHLQETVHNECEERFELTEALSVAKEELLQLKKPPGNYCLYCRLTISKHVTPPPQKKKK